MTKSKVNLGTLGIISFAVALICLVIYGFTTPSPSNKNFIKKYSCDVAVISLNTKIDTKDKNNNDVVIEGNILTLVTDPLSMKDKNGNIIAYAGDTYNFVSQDDHGIYLNGEFYCDMRGQFDLFGQNYKFVDKEGNVIATANFNFNDTIGKMYDANGMLIAEYTSAWFFKDYNLYIYDDTSIDINAIQMAIASYVSDKEADGSN